MKLFSIRCNKFMNIVEVAGMHFSLRFEFYLNEMLLNKQTQIHISIT